MALTEQQLDILSEALQPLFQYLEKEVIADVARRIQKTLTYTRTAELQAMSMHEMGFSPAKIRSEAMKLLNADKEFRKQVEENTLKYKKEVRELIKEITEKAKEAGDEIVANAGTMAWIEDMRVWQSAGKELEDNSFLHQLVETFSKQTRGELKNLTQTTGFKMMSGYESLESVYRRELDKAMIKICTGTFSREQVLKDTIHALAQSGLRSIDFESGRSMQLDTASRVALRTGCHQLAGRVSDKNIEQMGENLVYVSAHWGARNTGTGHANHARWQGKVYCIKEGPDYSEEAARIHQDSITELWEATGYSVDGTHENDPLGLNGYNCRHNHHPWFEGVSSLPKNKPEPKPVTYNGKTYDYYAMTQKMRSMERGVRALKREKEALSELGMDVTHVKAAISKKTNEYMKFCDLCKINPKHTLLEYECGTSNLKKTKAWKRYKDTTNGNVLEINEYAKYNIPEGADLSNWKLKKVNTTPEQDLMLANIHYNKGGGYTTNCQRCVPAYEMRRRGYDVTAKPQVQGYDIVTSNWLDIFEGVRPLVNCGQGSGLTKIQTTMKGYGDGARAQVYVEFAQNHSHVFVAEQRNGKTIFMDPQDGSRDASDYFNHVVHGKTMMFRIDDKIPSDLIKECCEEYNR